MVDNGTRPGAEASAGGQASGAGTQEHVDFGSRDVVELSETTACSADSSEGVGFVEDEAVFVLVLELNLDDDET